MTGNFLFCLLFCCTCIKLVRLATINDKCPSPENLRKCTCKVAANGIQVTCTGIATDGEVKQHLEALKGYSVAKLEISNFEASWVPTDLFVGLHVQELVLDKIDVQDASFRRGKLHLQGLEDSLTSLTIGKSFRKDRPLLNFQLDHLRKLQVVLLEHNNIPEVGNDWFATGPAGLSVLIFERNGIEELGDQAFSALNNLRLLAVAGNHLRSISRSMLPKEAHRLTTLDLAENKILRLPTDIFTGMPALKDLNLENNFIHMLDESTWSPVFSQLDSLKLGNWLDCDKEMEWICGSKIPTTTYAKCASPPSKKGLNLHALCKQ